MTSEGRTTSSTRLRIDVHLHDDGLLASLADDVRAGLLAPRKWLLPKYFYDAAGSELFERITVLPEYYPTRAERRLLSDAAAEITRVAAPREIVELGSGSSSKTRVLLDAASDGLRRYIPFDVSESIVRTTAAELLDEYPLLDVHGVIGDFERHLDHIPVPQGRRLVLLLGGTIGNLDAPERIAFLAEVRKLLQDGHHFLLGLDIVKDTAVVEAAYDDSAGVTAEFNRNILRVINRGLGADFDPDAFDHRVFFNAEASRIEMHLVSRERQSVHVAGLELTITLEAGETIWTESSYKFTRESVQAMLGSAGMHLEHWYVHPNSAERFGLALARPTPGST